MHLQAILAEGESEKVEFKTSLSDLNRLVEEVAALANTRGGYLVVGVRDDGSVSGLDVGRGTVERVSQMLMDHTDPKIFPELSVEEIEGKRILVIRVQESHNKPHLAFGRPWKRVGRSSVQMSREEYERILLEKHRQKLRFDNKICANATLEDIDENKIRKFLEKASAERGLELSSPWKVEEVLERLGLMQKNQLTNAALLLFGKTPQQFFPQAEIRCAKFRGTAPGLFLDMKVLGDAITVQIEEAVKFVLSNIRLVPSLDQIQREEQWEYPLPAVREAIVNALVHRDYSSSANVQISIFDDRLEVRNPGLLPEPLTPEALKGTHPSIPRNPLIAKAMFLWKYIEQWGRGTNRIMEQCLGYGLPEPTFLEELGGFVAVLYGRRYLVEELNQRQRQLLAHMEAKAKEITRSQYQKLVNIPDRTARMDLEDLVKRGYLQRLGRGKNVKYVLRGFSPYPTNLSNI
ncbi:ATP-dependent DNA helicase RecG [Candidatus Hakubella thermalkaliphila]|uniref:ATP-dependent DNA helicase RecG n=3 Tax=Candidatus Hakubella thermalkaliphila TaxID=2754717 RepID=A0A6V8PJ47_9ACTN|nr:ATP-dependent DNA helicase RecG [Candidatus Hakubella thermalkaliphila]